MSYLNTTIRHLITEKIGRNTFLPAIQREYVWSPYQVEKLFDSLMCGYPISSFLLWRIREENKKEWISYEFIRDFDEEKPHNHEANLDGVNQDVFLVLDGQQRITSLNIGLRGSYRYFYRRWRKTKLFLNLLWNHDNDNPEELTYQFLFKEDDQPIPKTDYPQFWYRVGDILNYDDISDTIENVETRLSSYTKDEIAQARRIITKLYSVINVTEVINYYEEKSDNYDKVLEIFIRTNTGGQKLEYSDILLSTATAKWKELNAREEINNFTDEINKIGVGYNFGKDFVMKGAMYLTEDLPIQYKLSSFTQSNLEKIEDHWDTTKDAIRNAVQLISRYGFNDKNLVTKLALLPIAQYLRNICSKNYIISTNVDDVKDQNNIQKWLIFIILKNGLGGSSDTKLTQMRKIVDAKYDRFPYAELNKEMLIESCFNDMELESLLQTNYGTRYSYLILSLLYPGRDWKDKTFNEDHIFPQTEFQRKKLKARGYDDERIDKYLSCYNSIANLELLDDSENKSKNAKPFEEWLSGRDLNFRERHHIPQMEDYSFDNFLSFIEKRKLILLESLRKITFEE
jgi:uncharacterized protein with ParB-like and HNH nuclease domain